MEGLASADPGASSSIGASKKKSHKFCINRTHIYKDSDWLEQNNTIVIVKLIGPALYFSQVCLSFLVSPLVA